MSVACNRRLCDKSLMYGIVLRPPAPALILAASLQSALEYLQRRRRCCSFAASVCTCSGDGDDGTTAKRRKSKITKVKR